MERRKPVKTVSLPERVRKNRNIKLSRWIRAELTRANKFEAGASDSRIGELVEQTIDPNNLLYRAFLAQNREYFRRALAMGADPDQRVVNKNYSTMPIILKTIPVGSPTVYRGDSDGWIRFNTWALQMLINHGASVDGLIVPDGSVHALDPDEGLPPTIRVFMVEWLERNTRLFPRLASGFEDMRRILDPAGSNTDSEET